MSYEVVCAVEAEQTETTIENGFTSDTAKKWEEIYQDVFQDERRKLRDDDDKREQTEMRKAYMKYTQMKNQVVN